MRPHVSGDLVERILRERGDWVNAMVRWARRTDALRPSMLTLPETSMPPGLAAACAPAAPEYFVPEPSMGQIVVYALVSLRDRSVLTLGSTFEWPIRWGKHARFTTENNSSPGSFAPFGHYCYISGFTVTTEARDLETDLWRRCGEPAAARKLWDKYAAEVVAASHGRLSLHYAFSAAPA